ncbi:phage portal protein [Bergeriella denitrificans]|uniref:Phage associated protein n=1 Tax=Bergeriella denitrificans TaxID=494 RepID=A0A378UKY0_BERDE|nr:phage portal protein [Bergeriella denitrificans]STZ77353.1 phage associated protein [Bergeriella denitrificans]
MGNKTPLSAGFVARAAEGIKFALTGKSDWFNAGSAPPPVAPDDVKGRAQDYEPYWNTGQSRPRQGEAVGFRDLRYLADNYDILRLVIETRKDQMEKLDWTIQRRDVEATADDESKRKDGRIDDAVAFFRRPDKLNNWNDWLRMLLEDLFVIDAPCIYPRKTLGGDLYALELIDGATIKRVIDDYGRTPMPPETAYQQVLRGLPAVDYTADELIYRPRNQRTYKVYGYSPVEQIITTVNIALRRMSHQLEYYRSGSVPDALVGVPESWTRDDIQRFQDYWDLLISGNNAERRKMRFVPGELSRNFHETKQPPLKDMYDEWLARVVCFCFSIEPTPFVAQVNRAVAETSREQSLAEGLEPLKNWVKSIIDDVLSRFMGMAEYEFVWVSDDAQSPREQAEIFVMYANANILTVDEVRAELGRDPLPKDEMPSENGKPDDDEPPPDGESGKPEKLSENIPDNSDNEAEKLGKSESPISAEEAAALIEAELAALSDDVAAQVAAMLKNAAIDFEADDWQAEVRRIAETVSQGLDFAPWAVLAAAVEPVLRQAAQQAAYTALIQVMPAPAVGMVTAIRARAAAWAAQRAAEMVGMKWVDGLLVQNPNAEWQITEGARGMIRQAVKDALENGDSPAELAGRLKTSHAFSKTRATTIARTEMARADGMGTYIGWSETGLVNGKEWLTAEDDKVSEICNENGAAGVVGLHEHFPSGDLMPPSHPNCRCVVLPVVDTAKLAKGYNPNQPRDKSGRWTDGSPAITVSGDELGSFDDTKTMRKAAMQYARDHFVGKTYRNESSGHDIQVTWQGVKHAASNANPVELALFVKLDELPVKLKYEASFPDKSGRPDIIAAHKYSGIAVVGNERLNIGMVVRELKDGHKYYDHFVLKDE